MVHRITAAERQLILLEMLNLARFLTARSVPPPEVRDAVKRLRDDLKQMIAAGVQTITVDQESYLPAATDKEQPA